MKDISKSERGVICDVSVSTSRQHVVMYYHVKDVKLSCLVDEREKHTHKKP